MNQKHIYRGSNVDELFLSIKSKIHLLMRYVRPSSNYFKMSDRYAVLYKMRKNNCERGGKKEKLETKKLSGKSFERGTLYIEIKDLEINFLNLSIKFTPWTIFTYFSLKTSRSQTYWSWHTIK